MDDLNAAIAAAFHAGQQVRRPMILPFVSRVASNDPELTHLELLHSLPKDQLEEFIEALLQNTAITSVCICQASFGMGFELDSSDELELLCALFALKNLEAIEMASVGGFDTRDIGAGVKFARKLKKLKIRDRVIFRDEQDAVFVKALQEHPSLEEIAIDRVYFGHCGKNVGEDVKVSHALARAVSSIPNLKSFSTGGLPIDVETFVKLVEKPTLCELELTTSGLSDEHILPMVETLLKKRGHLERLDMGGPQHLTGNPLLNKFSQEGWEALFRLTDCGAQIKITATAMYGEQEFVTFCLDDADAVQQHLERLEALRLLRLCEAGFDDLVPDESLDAALIDVVDKVSDDSIALYRVLQANPSICRNAKRAKRHYP